MRHSDRGYSVVRLRISGGRGERTQEERHQQEDDERKITSQGDFYSVSRTSIRILTVCIPSRAGKRVSLHPFLPNLDEEMVAAMLKKIGAQSMQELFADIP